MAFGGKPNTKCKGQPLRVNKVMNSSQANWKMIRIMLNDDDNGARANITWQEVMGPTTSFYHKENSKDPFQQMKTIIRFEGRLTGEWKRQMILIKGDGISVRWPLVRWPSVRWPHFGHILTKRASVNLGELCWPGPGPAKLWSYSFRQSRQQFTQISIFSWNQQFHSNLTCKITFHNHQVCPSESCGQGCLGVNPQLTSKVSLLVVPSVVCLFFQRHPSWNPCNWTTIHAEMLTDMTDMKGQQHVLWVLSSLMGLS